MVRTLFIWDIHGCYEELVELYAKMWANKNDIIYSTGDIINWWPSSFEVIQFLFEHNIQPVLGNHEINFFRYIENDAPSKIQKPIFDELIEKLKGNIDLFHWLKNLPRYIENADFLLVHAGLKPNVSLQEQELDDLTRIRLVDDAPWHKFYTDTKMLIYGHWAQQGLRFTKNTRWLDSGCMWGGHLTGYCLETGDLWQVRAHTMYWEPDNWKGDK